MSEQTTDVSLRGKGEKPRVLGLTLQTSVGTLQGDLAVPPSEMRLSELAWNFMALDEKLIGMTVAFEAGHGRKISCRKGCAACCCHAVPLSPPEAWMISEMVAALPEEQREQILGRFHLLQAILAKNGLGDAPLLSEAKEYFRTGAHCPPCPLAEASVACLVSMPVCAASPRNPVRNAGYAAAILGLRDQCANGKNKNPGAANTNHAQPFGNVPAVVLTSIM